MKDTLLALIFFCIGFSAYAQQPITVGELLSKGATKLTKEDIASIYAGGVTISGISPGGSRKIYVTYLKDGTLSGRSTDLDDLRGYGLMGTWSINNEAQLCTQVRNTYGRDVTPNPPCSFRFKLGDMLYSAQSEEPDTPARPLTIRK